MATKTDDEVVDPRIIQLAKMSTKDLATMFIGICQANPDGDEDWKQLIREELKQRKDVV